MGLVWYAAYGSNLDRRRFHCYVAGGRPPGSTRDHPGCRDRSPPPADRPLRLPFPLYFAGEAASWGGGGVAFLDPAPDADPSRATLARAWLLTEDQLADVVAQENGTPPPGDPLPWDALISDGAATVGSGWYQHLLLCGELDGRPVVTFTSSTRLPARAPGAAYRRVVAAGLQQAHGLTAAEADRYLTDRAAP